MMAAVVSSSSSSANGFEVLEVVDEVLSRLAVDEPAPIIADEPTLDAFIRKNVPLPTGESRHSAAGSQKGVAGQRW